MSPRACAAHFFSRRHERITVQRCGAVPFCTLRDQFPPRRHHQTLTSAPSASRSLSLYWNLPSLSSAIIREVFVSRKHMQFWGSYFVFFRVLCCLCVCVFFKFWTLMLPLFSLLWQWESYPIAFPLWTEVYIYLLYLF